jgi:hypothetical protein
MRVDVTRRFEIAHPGSADEARAFLLDVPRSLGRVTFIKNLRLEGDTVRADLAVDVPFLGQQLLDFESRLEPHAHGARLVPQPRDGRAWAMVGGDGVVTPSGATGSTIHYALEISVYVALPSSEKWGGKAFEKMAQATAEKAIERMTLEFPRGVGAAAQQDAS